MATEEEREGDNFTGLGPADTSELDEVPDSGLDSKPNIAIKTKPRPVNRYTSTVAPIVEEKLVKIDDDLFKKILFFTLFYPSDAVQLKTVLHGFIKISDHEIFKGLLHMLYYNKNNKTYDIIEGFFETIFVFYHYLKTINFYRNIESSKDIYNFSNCNFVMNHPSIEFKYTEFMFDIKNTAREPISLGRLDDTDLYNRHESNFNSYSAYRLPIRVSKLYAEINLSSEPGNSQEFPTGIDTYITQTDFNTLSNYVALLEKLIDEEIVIELRDGGLFVDDIKIGYKSGCIKSIGNAIRKTCRNIFTRAATIGFEDNPKKVLYDTIFSIYTNPKLIAIVNRNIRRVSDGGRNNKTRKRHRNKASHKKMRKSHNIRKRKTTGKKRK